MLQLDLYPISDHLPAAQSVQPSVAEVALALVDYWPAGHSCVSQEVFCPDQDHLPAPQSVQPSVKDVAASFVDFCPGEHSWIVQLVLTPDND